MRSLRRPHPESRPLLWAPEGPAAKPERGDAHPPGFRAPRAPAHHRPTPDCSGLARLGRASYHHPGALALSPSPSRSRGGHHAPNVTSERHLEERREE